MLQLEIDIQQTWFWLALGKIVWIDILLSGDNALVIAMACRALPARQRLWGMILGAGAAVLMRVLFTGAIATLMELSYLKLVGGTLLIYVAAHLLVPEQDGTDDDVAPDGLLRAVVLIVIADATMSLDNVIAVAAASNGSVALLALGLIISIPLIVAGASVITKLLDAVPALIWLGAALLGFVAGEVIATDPALGATFKGIEPLMGVVGVAIALLVGYCWRQLVQQPEMGT
jgi:YjbE family integral membrane protein